MEDLIDEIGKELLPSQAANVYKTLGKVLGNIVRNPDEPKFRSLKKDNKIVAETLGKSKSAIALLLKVGFKDVGSMYQCPPSVDLTDLTEAAELVECLADSMGTDSAEVPKSAAPAPATTTAQSAGYPKSAAPKAQPLKGFARNTGADEERKRAEQADQLAAIRATKATRSAEPALPPAQDTQPAQKQADVSSKPIHSAFDFESKSKKEQKAKAAEQSLDDLRAAQKAKYNEDKSDPNAWKAADYQKPTGSGSNGKEEKSWWDPSGWFGGGSSSNDKKPKPGGGAPPGPPRMKTINDLPKPVRRGG
eukprot:gnl/MRDRNA2_/MRDRNA2_106883_c0_seq1.p1 gnl/MRDRNA2_/MRDRNA2_106883_c0~~gnl/MRDRNA2_/MRDRNA2_106883_c0_seq1.p1  ORF type:complete len:306 (-),score=86.73 gnl/MRDRNA2_/MRDRNA2_106883_c0_seq1:179-1096(-)